MRLLNVRTLELREFAGPDVPRYAIFSHVGQEGNEVSHQEWNRVLHLQKGEKFFLDSDPIMVGSCKATRNKTGFVKISNFMETLRRLYSDIEWAWTYTICVDRTSLAEVCEATNAHYAWCQRAATCLAFLDDVPPGQPPLKSKPPAFCATRWFRRSWALAELLAPPEVKFFDNEWHYLSNRRELSDVIFHITRIEETFLTGGTDPKSVPAAYRLSWARNRETTRPEDVAYSLMGLLDVHMMPIYGEGAADAFRRLQEKALRHTGDGSLLTWGFRGGGAGRAWTAEQRSGPLASHPSQFATCRGIAYHSSTSARGRPSAEYSVTNRGVWVTATLVRPHQGSDGPTTSDYVHLVLDYTFERGQILLPLIPVRRGGPTECDEYWRAPSCAPICVRPSIFSRLDHLTTSRRRILILREAPAPARLLSLRIEGLDSAGYSMVLQEIWPPTVCRDGMEYLPVDDDDAAGGTCGRSASSNNSIDLGRNSNADGRPVSSASSSTSSSSSPQVQWILLRLWTYFENVVVMLRYQGKQLAEAPSPLLPPSSPRQQNPTVISVKMISMTQLPNWTVSQVPRSLEDYFRLRPPTPENMEALFRTAGQFKPSQPVAAIVRQPPTVISHERHEIAARRKPGYRLPQWTVELVYDRERFGTTAHLDGIDPP